VSVCPSCHDVLTRQQTPNGMVYICPHCGGRAAALQVLRKAHATDSFCRDLWLKACAPDAPQSRPCPHCGLRMTQVTMPGTEGPLKLDVCRTDEAVWFDPNEFQDVPLQPAAPQSVESELPPQAREKLALLKLQSLKEQEAESPDAGPDESWQWLPAIFGLPVEFDALPMLHRPGSHGESPSHAFLPRSRCC